MGPRPLGAPLSSATRPDGGFATHMTNHLACNHAI